ncbi:MAG: alpha-amylase/4-alpha-glucanotransferase domain-containing protein [Chlorobiales bacterium]
MKKINLIFATHNHQPIGNFDSVFVENYDRAYKPFLDVFEQFPNLKIAKHYTGILFEWLLQHRPELLTRLKSMVDKGNIELISGGFYEPILAVIPDEDKVGQVEKLTKFIKKQFDYDAKGLWLAERIWEQHLVKPLAEAGVQYVILDDTHFKYAGLSDEQLYGYYITEEQGYTTCLFPVSKTLRYTIPFEDVSATIEYLRSIATDDGKRIAVFADDGEKFGGWPGTYEHTYTRNHWLEKFFKALDDNRDWIRTMTFKEALAELKPIGRIYLANASYAEMMHWALPNTKAFQDYETFEKRLKEEGLYNDYNIFLRGGFWRNFMVKYPESNQMHKRMLEVSKRARLLQEKKLKVSAHTFDKIWAAQCNCPYWHGVFGGTYLPNLRHPIYENLIDAELDLDKLDNKNGDVLATITDFDADGQDEVILKNTELSLYFKPSDGGKLIELDYKPAKKNLLDVVTRREEGYHRRLLQAKEQKAELVAEMHNAVQMKESGLESQLVYDWYRRASLVEHFLPLDTTLDELKKNHQRELGDFLVSPFEATVSGTKAKRILSLTRVGNLHFNGVNHALELSKTITLAKGKSEFAVDYTLTLHGEGKIKLYFGVENLYGLLAGDAPDRYYYFDGITLENNRLNSVGEVRSTMAGLKDEWLKIHARLEATEEARVIRYPIETISLSEGGFERVYQGSCVVMLFEVEVSKKPIELSLVQRFSRT